MISSVILSSSLCCCFMMGNDCKASNIDQTFIREATYDQKQALLALPKIGVLSGCVISLL
ncbi:hypothetical protein GQ55_5G508500 [Panicum hallii var. hallii]|uniref:Uncharacterized protein n=2 Tax=Panicum hallii TaxID=206008 RepID=A0A2T7DS82_9POAL|nr:hypothetical protein PAHAL_5G503500 [Panicum hallii]PUZ58425.1 hypothetical protein GQ55_5G508500 [Panicum hallii var. hallii]